ncbi:MAG: translation elongation factor Ts [bacterium]|nr:translation elongation factor Ts [bacterium]
MIDSKLIAQLRAQTGAGIVDCKKALEEGNGDFTAAVEYLRKRGQKVAANKQERETKEGLVYANTHTNGRVGALVELLCETDFVARTDDFKQLAHDISLQIIAMNPLYVKADDVPAEVIDKELEIYKEQMGTTLAGKPQEMVDKIMQGKIAKYYEEACLIKQKFIKDDSMTIEDLITKSIGKIGENIQVKRFCRFSL